MIEYAPNGVRTSGAPPPEPQPPQPPAPANNKGTEGYGLIALAIAALAGLVAGLYVGSWRDRGLSVNIVPPRAVGPAPREGIFGPSYPPPTAREAMSHARLVSPPAYQVRSVPRAVHHHYAPHPLSVGYSTPPTHYASPAPRPRAARVDRLQEFYPADVVGDPEDDS